MRQHGPRIRLYTVVLVIMRISVILMNAQLFFNVSIKEKRVENDKKNWK